MGLFIYKDGLKSQGSLSRVAFTENELIYTIVPDVLIENNKVYFAKSDLNAGMHLVDGKLYAEEVPST